MQIDKISFKSVANFEYTGLMRVTSQGHMYGIDSGLNVKNTCYHSGQNTCPFPALQIMKRKLQRAIISPTLLQVREKMSLTIRKQHRLKSLSDHVFGLRRDDIYRRREKISL